MIDNGDDASKNTACRTQTKDEGVGFSVFRPYYVFIPTPTLRLKTSVLCG